MGSPKRDRILTKNLLFPPPLVFFLLVVFWCCAMFSLGTRGSAWSGSCCSRHLAFVGSVAFCNGAATTATAASTGHGTVWSPSAMQGERSWSFVVHDWRELYVEIHMKYGKVYCTYEYIYIYVHRHKRRRDDYNGTQAIMMCNTSGLEYWKIGACIGTISPLGRSPVVLHFNERPKAWGLRDACCPTKDGVWMDSWQLATFGLLGKRWGPTKITRRRKHIIKKEREKGIETVHFCFFVFFFLL